jgi:hypothetical protein
LFLRFGEDLPVARRVAHDGKEKEHFEGVDEDEDGEKDIEAGEGELGEAAEEGVSQKWHPEHAGGEKKAGFELAISGMEEGEGEGEGDRADDDKEKQDQCDLLAGVHVRDWG